MTYTKDEAHIKIAKLVEDFYAHEATSEKVPGTQVDDNLHCLSYKLYRITDEVKNIEGV